MTAKAKAKIARRKQRPDLSEGPTGERLQHTPFMRDRLTPPGAPAVARHRTRTILTPLAVRQAILEDAAAKPEAVRLRSLRRRLTVLDRALSSCEAGMLERLTSCINGLSNVGCLDYLKSEVRSSPVGRLPFNENKRREIAAMTFVLKRLSFACRSAVLELAALLDPSHSLGAFKPNEEFIESVRSAAGAVVSLYEEWSRQERERSK
ncbi:MAG: hypothetical protein HY765_08665 [Rhodomicrobium sp.]|nr:hypothetical protein [Rhodomicrobium sp.]